MNEAATFTTQLRERQEDFPVDSFRYLEARLQAIRNLLMRVAAEFADGDTPRDSDVYRVGRDHIDRAIAHIMPLEVACPGR